MEGDSDWELLMAPLRLHYEGITRELLFKHLDKLQSGNRNVYTQVGLQHAQILLPFADDRGGINLVLQKAREFCISIDALRQRMNKVPTSSPPPPNKDSTPESTRYTQRSSTKVYGNKRKRHSHHSTIDNVPFKLQCPQCEKNYTHWSDVVRHFTTTHEKYESWVCTTELCNEGKTTSTFYDKSSFNRHHQEKHCCPECETHIREKCGKKIHVKCEGCKHAEKAHIIHHQPTGYGCGICKTFYLGRKEYLSHIRNHLQESIQRPWSYSWEIEALIQGRPMVLVEFRQLVGSIFGPELENIPTSFSFDRNEHLLRKLQCFREGEDIAQLASIIQAAGIPHFPTSQTTSYHDPMSIPTPLQTGTLEEQPMHTFPVAPNDFKNTALEQNRTQSVQQFAAGSEIFAGQRVDFSPTLSPKIGGGFKPPSFHEENNNLQCSTSSLPNQNGIPNPAPGEPLDDWLSNNGLDLGPSLALESYFYQETWGMDQFNDETNGEGQEPAPF